LGGLEKFAADLHHQFGLNGHHVTVFTSDIAPFHSGYQDCQLTPVYRYPAFDIIFGYPVPKIWSSKFWRLFLRTFKTKHDLVISSTRFFLSSLLALFYSKTTNTPWLHIEHGSDYVKSDNFFVSILARLYDESLGRLVLNLSDINIAPSTSAQKFINKFDSRHCPTIYRGIHKKEIDTVKPDTTFKNLYPNKTIITFAGRFIDGKGIPDFLIALSKIPSDKYVALLIGSGPLHEKLVALAAKHNISNQVIFSGQKTHNQTIALLKVSDILVNPSYNEGLPTTLLEACLSGCAVLATNVGGTPEIISHNKSGLLYAPHNRTSLSHHLLELLSNPTLRHKLSQNAISAVQRKFNWQKSYQQYMEAINTIIK
jgi:glycosyltransferase involved in cell wall biosynthesis